MANVKALIIDSTRYSVVTQSFEYKPSGQVKTPIIGDDGKIIDHTVEFTGGMMKGKFSTLKSANTINLRTITESEIIAELTSGINVVGSNCTQIGDNSIVVSDSVVEFEFSGDITEN